MADEIHANEGYTFRYGRFDCCIFCARVIKAMTGEDRLSAWRYSNRAEAMQLLESHGGLEGAVSHEMGAPKNPAMAKRGDIVMVEDDGGSLGVCVGADVLYPARPAGLARAKITEAIAAWSV